MWRIGLLAECYGLSSLSFPHILISVALSRFLIPILPVSFPLSAPIHFSPSLSPFLSSPVDSLLSQLVVQIFKLAESVSGLPDVCCVRDENTEIITDKQKGPVFYFLSPFILWPMTKHVWWVNCRHLQYWCLLTVELALRFLVSKQDNMKETRGGSVCTCV